tara:strand:- start:6068 stop:7144 length:1077 start_codon:yes stop_codon:yes gene_type:complete
MSITETFRLSDLKYLMAYTGPLIAFLGISNGGYWIYSALFYLFVIIPLLELLLTKLGYDTIEEVRENERVHWIFDLMLYLNFLIIMLTLYLSINAVIYTDLSTIEFVGLVLTTGVILSSNGINVAHELCHRENVLEKSLGKVMLIPSLFMHFYLEHNFGHHLNVATKEDPVTAKYNEPLYLYWITTPIKEIISAIKIQKNLLNRTKSSFFSIKNDLLFYIIIQSLYLFLITYFFGYYVLLFVLLSALASILFFESVNYIEHYGLLREKNSSGRYERVRLIHSWNSNHVIGRIVLYELTRHSDHHYKTTKKYQNLVSFEEAPQLPYGYPTSILLAMVPWLWFKIMNPRIPKNMIMQLNN